MPPASNLVRVEVSHSLVVDAPLQTVWKATRNFTRDLAICFPGLTATVEDGGHENRVGDSVRVIPVGEGKFVRERLVTLCDETCTQRYRILMDNEADRKGNPFPGSVENYIGTYHLQELKDGNKTFASWKVQFDTEPEQVQTMTGAIGAGVCQGALEKLRDHFKAK